MPEVAEKNIAGIDLEDCLRLVVSGGTENTHRGMTLWGETAWLDVTLNNCFNLEQLISCQEVLLERSIRIYNKSTVDKDRALLTSLIALREVEPSIQRHRLLDLLAPITYD